ncbi:hypothetical protein [Nocardioides humi]|uniref:DUF3558 domain-containing protein n=1 Tax=Nocardioides humi TaxID=449461 RepID=A0ABN2A5S3_9ACTN|nr:hypothetical protein [Nocardioides humi]
MAPLPRIALAAAALLLLAGCGGADDPGEPPGSAGTASAPPSAGPSTTASTSDGPASTGGSAATGAAEDDGSTTVARARFCQGIDPADVADVLGTDRLEVMADHAPGDAASAQPGAPSVSPAWTCTIGTTADGGIGVTWSIAQAEVKAAEARATVGNLAGILGEEHCADVADDALGARTRGVDCAGSVGGTSFALAARSVVVDRTLLDCQLASAREGDIERLSAAAPRVCALFRDLVVRE